jgi:hypothetical protein
MSSGTEGTGGQAKRQVGDLCKGCATWYEHTAAGAWLLPVIEIEGVTFGVRIVHGELMANAECLPRLAGEEDAEQVQALRADLVLVIANQDGLQYEEGPHMLPFAEVRPLVEARRGRGLRNMEVALFCQTPPMHALRSCLLTVAGPEELQLLDVRKMVAADRQVTARGGQA